MSGSISDKTGFRTVSSKITTTLSMPLAMLGDGSSRNPRQSPRSVCAIGLISVRLHDRWYNMPVFQVSLKAGYDPSAHFALGRALATLRDDGVLIVGSGFSYHNLQMFGPGAKEPSLAFDAWLADALVE
jgi:hypothetical protein